MEWNDILGDLFVFVLFGAPVLAISVRLAVKPVAEAVARLRDSMGPTPAAMSRLATRVEAVERELDDLRSTVRRLEVGKEFRAELEAGKREGTQG